MTQKRLILSVMLLSGLAATGVWAATGSQRLTIDGTGISSDVRTLNGKAYVPVADVARYLKMTVSHGASGYALATAGGAGQDNGARQGKLGDVLFTGKWRVTVQDVTTADEYQERYYQNADKITPHGAGDTLVIVNCQLRNGLKQTQSPLLTERIPGNTAIADANGQSYAPIDIDARQDTNKIGSYEAAKMLPGSAVKFALVFSVPKGTVPSALVFTIGNYPDDVGGKGVDLRIRLK